MELEIDGKYMSCEDGLRIGHHTTIDSSDFVVWIGINSDRPVKELIFIIFIKIYNSNIQKIQAGSTGIKSLVIIYG